MQGAPFRYLGDARVSDNLIRHAQGVDLLVHEVAWPGNVPASGLPLPSEQRSDYRPSRDS